MAADDHLGIQFHSTQMDDLSTNHYAHVGGQLAGVAQTNHIPGDPVELAAIRVENNFQNRGIGGKLVEHVIQHHAGKTITTQPNPFGNYALDTDQLETFYSGHGFERMGNSIAMGMRRRAT